MVHDKYGAPAIIKGVNTYEDPLSESLLKNNIEYANGQWGPYKRRCGAIARKIGDGTTEGRITARKYGQQCYR